MRFASGDIEMAEARVNPGVWTGARRFSRSLIYVA
jgi:hypothetical protein